MNPFDSSLAARLYAQGRPFYHPLIADLIRPHVGDCARRALDVACGTGLSTRILLESADEVTGCDASQPMLDAAFQDTRIRYAYASATEMPFQDAQFDIITLGSGLHWFDGIPFVHEAVRLLAPGGHLIIYDHGFAGEMSYCPQYAEWHRSAYLGRFPPPPRGSGQPNPALMCEGGLIEVASTTFAHHWPFFSADALAGYLLTQSNVLAAAQGARLIIEGARAWIIAGASPAFRLAQELFRFTGRVTIWKRVEGAGTYHGR